MIVVQVFSVLVFLTTISLIKGNCDSFQSICTLELGKPIEQLNQNKHIVLHPNEKFFFKFANVDGNAIDRIAIELSIYFGQVDIFVAKSGEPGIDNFDYSNLFSGYPSSVLIKNNPSAPHNGFYNVLIQSKNLESVYFRGLLISYSQQSSSTISLNGEWPNIIQVPADYTLNVQMMPKDSSMDALIVTSYSALSPQVGLKRPNANVFNYSWANDGVLTFSPSQQEVNKIFKAKVKQADQTVPLTLAFRDSNDLNKPMALLSGYAFNDFVVKRSEHYYKIYVPSGISSPIVVVLDPVQGDSDLFVNPESQGVYHRTGSNPSNMATWVSQKPKNERDIVTIDPNDPNYVHGGGLYYVTVYGFEGAKYMVRFYSSENAQNTLVEGYPMQGDVKAHSYRYFNYFDSHSTGRVIFDLIPSYGDADLYIDCRSNPTGDDSGIPSILPGHYNFSSHLYLEDAIAISADDPNNCGGNRPNDVGGGSHVYYLAVYGYSDSIFTLNAYHSSNSKILLGGITVTGKVYDNIGQLFKVRVGFESEQLKVQMTPQYGDCDIYVRMGAIPSVEHFDYSSTNAGTLDDKVTIPENDICVDCWVYILVYGYQTSEFSLTASFSDKTISLNNGVPLKGSAARADIQYYTYKPAVACDVEVVATLTNTGEVTLYISKDVEKPDANSASTTIRRSNSGANAIPEARIQDVAKDQIVYIGVEGANSNATYTIRASDVYPSGSTQPPTLLTLLDGIPQSDAISFSGGDSDWLYYKIKVPMGHESIDLRTTLIIGDVDLFVSKCTLPVYQCAQKLLPNSSYYLVTTVGFEDKSLTIYRNDPVDTYYLIGVNTLSQYSVFHLSSAFENTILTLQEGVSVMDHVANGEYDYYSFYLGETDAILQFVLTPISGDPDIFISNMYRYPSSENSTWYSFERGGDVLTIDTNSDAHACVYCMFYIAVYGTTESTYSLTLNLQNKYTHLTDGNPISGSVDLLGWNKYSFIDTFGNDRDIRISLTSSSGFANLYVTLDGREPTLESNDFFSDSMDSIQEVDITPRSPKFAPCLRSKRTGRSQCKVIIGVYGFTASEYSLTLSTSSALTLLQLGIPQVSSIAQNAYISYKLILSQQAATSPYTLRITANPSSGDISLFASCQFKYPNATFYDWTFSPSNLESHLDILSLDVEDKGCLSSSGLFYVSVYGDSAARYSLSANTLDSDSIPTVIPGIAYPDSVANHQFKYYYLRPGQLYQDIKISLTIHQGDADFFISDSWDERPHLEGQQVKSYFLSSRQTRNNFLVINHDVVQTECHDKSYCYFIIGVLGSFNSDQIETSYSLTVSTTDSTTLLYNGVPKLTRVDQGHMEYFKYSLVKKSDLNIAITSFTGDPDMFIGIGSLKHPTRSNFTWAQTLFGADSLTIQYSDIEKKCIPEPGIHGHHCDFYIGVFGWLNSTFTILVTTNDGFKSPVSLLDQQPQSGHVDLNSYIYYQYAVSVEPPGKNSKTPPVSIKFVLTPTDGGDVDLYMKVAGNNRTLSEPGKNNYDLKSAGWSSVSEQIDIAYGSPFYCLNCVIYLAVFGYTKGSYTIQATSTGINSLQPGQPIGGLVLPKNYDYFSFFNDMPFAVMGFTLTLLSGDADLYITTVQTGQDESEFKFPSEKNYIWRSMNFGSDAIHIDYEDNHFCYNCEYIIGVYGYRNSTYTLMATSSEASVIKLIDSRPQAANLEFGKLLYFSSSLVSSTADVTISITPLNTGHADMYVKLYNQQEFDSAGGGDAYRLPDPMDPTSYQYTTEGTENNHIFIGGPHEEEQVIVITVYAISTIKFNIISSASSSVILLQSGIPQSHFVMDGKNELFKFYPETDEDLRISISARSGDPDLYVSSEFANPHCVSGDYSWQINCYNYTWSSKMYSTDQIIISRDYPCRPMLPTTYVAPSCNPRTSYEPSLHKPVYIGIYGYRTAKFTVLAAPIGKQLHLLPGKPQVSSTTPGFICSQRSETSGACLDSSAISKRIQVSYFSFHVSTGQVTLKNVANKLQPISEVILTVIPNCNMSRNHEPNCAPGCDCNPLVVYVSSCPLSKCTETDMKPSELDHQHKASLIVSGQSGSTLFLSSEEYKASDSSSLFCNPAVELEECGYFIAVTNPNAEEAATFTITARTPGDIIQIPCDMKFYPDGIKYSSVNKILTSPEAPHYETRFYEACSQVYVSKKNSYHYDVRPENLIIDIDQCYGESYLLACADNNKCNDVLPSNDDWEYFSDAQTTCIRSFNKFKSDDCIPNMYHQPYISLPQKEGNYYLAVNSTGMYALNVRSTINGIMASPMLLYAGLLDEDSAQVSVQKVEKDKAIIRFRKAQVLLPGLQQPSVAALTEYRAYLIDADALESVLSKAKKGYYTLETKCGVEYLLSQLPKESVEIAPIPSPRPDESSFFVSHQFMNLSPQKRYRLVVMATCDAACLKQLSQVTESANVLISCAGTESCKPQHLIYSTTEFSTGTASPTDTDGSEGDGFSGMHIFFNTVVVLVVLILLVSGTVFAYWYCVNKEIMQGYNELDLSSVHGFSTHVGNQLSSFFSSTAGSFSGSSAPPKKEIDLTDFPNSKQSSQSSNYKFSLDDVEDLQETNTSLSSIGGRSGGPSGYVPPSSNLQQSVSSALKTGYNLLKDPWSKRDRLARPDSALFGSNMRQLDGSQTYSPLMQGAAEEGVVDQNRDSEDVDDEDMEIQL